MPNKTILCFAGSTRKQSLNNQLAKQAADIVNKLGGDGQFIDLTDYPMPIYNGDDEQARSLPPAAITLKAKFVAADGFFIASPEYNSAYSSLLKNTIDWVSRSHEDDEPPMSAYSGKIAGIAAASPGRLGGLRGLVPLRMLLSNIGITVVPHQMAVASAYEKINDKGVYTDEATLNGIEQTISCMLSMTL